MYPESHIVLAEDVLAACRKAGLRVGLAESCTGGLIAGCLTAVPGSSDVVERGFVTYTNTAKTDMLGVPAAFFEAAAVGAVSEEVARAMAEGVLAHSPADVSVAVTGIAGPGGATDTKPVGLVHIASARRNHDTLHERHVFPGDRDMVRMTTVEIALRLLLRQVGDNGTHT